MMVRQLLPPGLAQLTPGPELGAVLAGLDIHALSGADLVEVLRARARQLSHEQAQLLVTMAEIGLCDPAAGPDEVGRLAQAPEWAADEIRVALAWTRNAAYREYHFAQTLLERLPTVFTALDTGEICRSKAWLFSDLCAQLTDEQAQVVCDRLLPLAGRLTTGELAARIRKLALALNPEWAARRYAAAVRDRDVIGYLDEDGAATVTGRRLPADQATAACARIDELARAAKRAGHSGRIGHLRADIYLGLLEGRWQHHTREEIIAELLACAGPEPTSPQPAPNHTPATNPTAAAHASPAIYPDLATEGDGGPAADAAAAPETADCGDGAQQPTVAEKVGVEVRVELSTLLDRDRHPGEIPGWGPITAETACGIVAAQHRTEWRYAITDPDGQLILAGITRRRPATTPGDEPAAAPPCRGGIVELHLPAILLTELAADPSACEDWAAVITDIAVQYHAYRTQQAQGDPRCAPGQDPGARFAGAALRRHVQIRDRYCVMIGCRCPARHADLDHTINHSRGGTTTQANSGPLCKHDHRVKHEGGWRLCQPEPGHFHLDQPPRQDLPHPASADQHRPARPPPWTGVPRRRTAGQPQRGRTDPGPAITQTRTPTVPAARRPRRAATLLSAPGSSRATQTRPDDAASVKPGHLGIAWAERDALG